MRSPIRFGLLIALLGCLDTAAVNLAQGYVVEKMWVDRLGTLALPFLWVLVSAVARGADDGRLSMHALSQLGRKPVWVGALGAGIILATVNGIIDFGLRGVRTGLGLHSSAYLQSQGEFLDSIETSVILMSVFVGMCYFPLLVLASEISPGNAAQLSRQASDMNGSITLIMLIGISVLIAGALASAVPAYGMTTAASLVFIGVLNYVAYRDIFERRSGNPPERAAETQAAADPQWVRGTSFYNSSLPRRVLISWIGLAAALVAATALADVPNDPTQVQPLAVGTRAPTFSAQTKDGALRTFSPDRYRKPTIVLFYRGGWCPYCNSQLSDLRLVEPRLRQSGFEIVFLSTDRPAILYSSLKAEKIHYTLLSDSRLEAAKAFHIAYHLDDATIATLKKYGVDLDASTGQPLHELPVPSVFIIDKTGTIRYVYSNPDYTIRLGADALWAAAQPYAVVK